jgi:PIN domain nuclease of toxin-antitoxin system
VKFLLDTHAFIWWDGDQTKLSPKVLAACQSPANTLHLSLGSVWKMQIKAQLGKETLRLPLADILREQQERNGLQIEPTTLDDILALSNLPSLHRDPSTGCSSPKRNAAAFK